MKHPGSCRAGVVGAIALLAVLHSMFASAQDPSREAEALAPYLRQAWHDVEVIIFERPGIGDVHAGENLMLAAPRRLPARFLALATPDWLTPARPLHEATRSAVETFAPGLARGQPDEQAGDRNKDPSTSVAEAAIPATDKPAGTGGIAEPPPPPSPEELFRAALKSWEDGVEASSFAAASAEDRALVTASERLVAQGGAHILWHERWSQALLKPGRSVPVLIQGGPLLTDRFLLEGTLDVARTETIEVHTSIWLNGPHVGREPILLAAGIAAHHSEKDIIPLVMDRYLAIDERQTLAPGELTYFDHPRFGVLIRVRPVTPPESVLEAFEAFRAGDDESRD